MAFGTLFQVSLITVGAKAVADKPVGCGMLLFSKKPVLVGVVVDSFDSLETLDSLEFLDSISDLLGWFLSDCLHEIAVKLMTPRITTRLFTM